jgi:hypothetical protein
LYRALRFTTWSLFALAVSFAGAASFLFVLGFPGFGREVFTWAQQSALMCGATFGLLSLLELEARVRDLEDRLPPGRPPPG